MSMISNVLLVGSEGSMGKRYQAILNKVLFDYAKNDGYAFDGYFCYDPKREETVYLHDLAAQVSGFIIATPTETHVDIISSLASYGKPILCEKPVEKDLSRLEMAIQYCEEYGTKLQMVNQYAYLYSKHTTAPISSVEPIHDKRTYYDYFRHGQDGLYWDCINIIGLAKEDFLLEEESPIWQCKINGHSVDFSDMDGAYLRMVLDWLIRPRHDSEYILKAHKKVLSQLVSCNS